MWSPQILSVEIECAGRVGIFPDPQHDSITCITNVVKHQGSDHSIVHKIFVCINFDSTDDQDVLKFSTEREMLLAWRSFVLEMDPDIIISYCAKSVESLFLVGRPKTLGLDGFDIFGPTMARGLLDVSEMVLCYCKNRYISSISLSAVSETLLGCPKKVHAGIVMNSIENAHLTLQIFEKIVHTMPDSHTFRLANSGNLK